MINYLRKLSRVGATDDLSEREIKAIVCLNLLILATAPVFVLNILLIAAYLSAMAISAPAAE